MFDHPPRGSRGLALGVFLAWLAVMYGGVYAGRTIQAFADRHGLRLVFLAVVLLFVCSAGLWVLGWFRKSARRLLSLEFLWLLCCGGALLFGAYTLRHNPEEAFHLVEYGLLSLLAYRVLVHRHRDPAVYITAFAVCGCLGACDEILQWIHPRRYFDFRDIMINASGALLVLGGIAFGLRPALVRPPVQPASARAAWRAVSAFALLLLACACNTLALQRWYTAHLPLPGFLRTLDEPMVEFGFRHEDPGVGAFYSRLELAELAAQDAAHARENAALLDRYQGDHGYHVFFQEVAPPAQSFLYELRIHLFRRDRHLQTALKVRRDARRLREAATVAYHEDLIIGKYFRQTYAASSYVLPASVQAALRELAQPDAAYVSAVSDHLTVRFKNVELQLYLLGLVLAVNAAGWYFHRKARMNHAAA